MGGGGDDAEVDRNCARSEAQKREMLGGTYLRQTETLEYRMRRAGGVGKQIWGGGDGDGKE